MKYEPIPITPDMVQWARKRAGFSLAEAAAKFKSIETWEAGDASPSYPQLETMADTFKVPIAVFFFPEPPDVPQISESFRSLPTKEYDRLPRRIRHLVRKAKVFQLNVGELEGGRNPSNRQILKDVHFDAATSIQDMARVVREYIGISLDEQKQWKTTDEAVNKWRAALYSAGVFVFKDQFKQEGYSGFCLYDQEFPLIYVNNTSAKSRQTFTLFHELAHLLFETSGIDSVTDDYLARLAGQQRAIEVKCNQFAAEFLLPEEEFDHAFSGLLASEETASIIAGEYNVSREFVFRRFLDRGLVSKRAYEEASKRWAQQRSGGSGGNYYNTKFTYLGREYVSRVFSHFYDSRIDVAQAAEYLDVKPKSLSGLEARLLQGAA